jgi:EAL domain-containing protein (putative c-di-GMP-specific phosphodiesterase class I)
MAACARIKRKRTDGNVSDPSHVLTRIALADILSQLARDSLGWYASYRGIELRSAFQPVLSVNHARIVGYEALLRAHDGGQPMTPPELFARAAANGEDTLLDLLCCALHATNFCAQRIDSGWLFLNVQPQLFEIGNQRGPFIAQLAKHLKLEPGRIVLEVLERASTSEQNLAQAVKNFHGQNFLIAIDDFGTGFSNFDRIWQTRPEIVKLDRSLITRVSEGNADHRMIRHLITMLHQAGSMVLAEGIENETELVILMEADIDFIQGYWLGRPDASIERACADAPRRIATMWPLFTAYQARFAGRVRVGFQRFEQALLAGAQVFVQNGDMEEAARRVFDAPGARRVFVTNAFGVQERPTITSAPVDPRRPNPLAPLFPDTPSNWSRRAYFKRAVASPGRVAVMGPHFSLTDGKDCYTAAVAVQVGAERMVFCANFLLPGAPDEPS